MTGIFDWSVPDSDKLSPRQILQSAADLGFDGCQFFAFLDLSPKLDPEELREIKVQADGLGLSLSACAGWINPFHPERAAGVRALAGDDFLSGLKKMIAAAANIGLKDLFFMVSPIEDRFDSTVPWVEQLAATSALLSRLAPTLREFDFRLLLKTHEEITTFEIVRLVESVGPDVLGVALDPVNLLVRLEDPVEATRRVAPYVGQVHLDDAILRFTEGGIRRILYPLGQGQIDWDAIIELIPDCPMWLETHRGQFSMPVFDPQWLAAQPDLTLSDLASVMKMATQSGSGAIPWDQDKPIMRLKPSQEAARRLEKLRATVQAGERRALGEMPPQMQASGL